MRLVFRPGLHSLAVFVVATLCTAVTAGATTGHPDEVGTNVTYSNIQESSNAGDPEPLWGAPSLFGDQLVFAPTVFEANSSGGGVDTTGSQLQLTITATSGTLDELLLEEFGDVIFGGSGTASTMAFLSMSGFVTVLETTSGPIAPVVIPFSGSFVPGPMLTLPADPGTTAWSGSATIDIAAAIANATVAQLSFDNDLTAASEAASSAIARKNEVRISLVPEPSTGLLLALGLLGLGRARHSRN